MTSTQIVQYDSNGKKYGYSQTDIGPIAFSKGYYNNGQKIGLWKFNGNLGGVRGDILLGHPHYNGRREEYYIK